MKSPSKVGITVLNAVIIALLCFAIAHQVIFFWNGGVADGPEPTVKPLLAKGVSFQPSQENVSQDGRRLIVYASATCEFSRASAGFYRRLSGVAREKEGLSFALITSDGASEFQEWTAGEFIQPTSVINSDSAALFQSGLFVTPTLVSVNGSGRIEAVWYGQLSESQEIEVLTYASGSSTTPSSDADKLVDVNRDELSRMASDNAVLLDVSGNRSPATDVPKGVIALSIPKNELRSRSKELAGFANVVIDCTPRLSRSICRSSAVDLLHLGLSRVAMLVP